MAAPDPRKDTLLPCNDDEFTAGRLGSNEALLSQDFYCPSSLGDFARMCQAVHVLGKVLRHVQTRETSTDVAALTLEALQLHRILKSLNGTLVDSQCGNITTENASHHSTLSLCCVAQLILYNLYACNEATKTTVSQERLAAEAELQHLSLAGIKELACKTIPQMATELTVADRQQPLGLRNSPVLAGCFYRAVTECAWFVKEDGDAEMAAAMTANIGALQVLKPAWAVCSEQ